MKTLCLFTNEFPYGFWEPYLETEVKYYDKFDRVIIFALQLRAEHAKTIREMPKNVKVIPVPYAPKWVYLLNSFCVLGDFALYREVYRLFKSGMFSVSRLVALFVYLSRSHYETGKILENVNRKQLKDAVFYSYRFEYQPYVAMLLRKKLNTKNPIICRAHRYDLYENFRNNGYIPMRRELLEHISGVYPCSDDGVRYLADKYPKYRKKIKSRFLGTVDRGIAEYNAENVYRIVSCSNVVPVKRLEIIVKSLSLIKDREIVWTHFGDGIMLDRIKKLAEKILPENIRTDFRGNVSNQQLMEEYKKGNFFIFLNVSESEGIPVSIMEAMSFGIPCIATDVGGTKEILYCEKAGKLIEADSTAREIADIIKSFIDMPLAEYTAHRENSRKSWKNKFFADENYSSFVKEILRRMK